jgi:GDP-L-fucose synthase
MHILLTGAGGFIGKNICEAFAGRHTLIAPTRQQLDLTDSAAVAAFFARTSIDLVIHSAVKPGHRNAADPSRQLYANTRMFFNLMRHADAFGKMIFLGSGAVYDTRNPLAKVREDYFDTHVPVDEHGFSKYIIAKYAEKADNIVKLRLFGIFGRYEDYAIRFISNAICKAICGLPITLRQNRRFDYLYVDDLMPVLTHFIDHKAAHASYNVTPDESVELLAVAELVRARSGKDIPIIVAEPGLGPEYSGDNSRLRTEIPDLAFTPLAAAINQLYDWYEKNRAGIDRNKLLVDK